MGFVCKSLNFLQKRRVSGAPMLLVCTKNCRFFHPFSIFPGPFWATATRPWIVYHEFKGNEPYTMWNEVQKHGKSLILCNFFLRKSRTFLLMRENFEKMRKMSKNPIEEPIRPWLKLNKRARRPCNADDVDCQRCDQITRSLSSTYE